MHRLRDSLHECAAVALAACAAQRQDRVFDDVDGHFFGLCRLVTADSSEIIGSILLACVPAQDDSKPHIGGKR